VNLADFSTGVVMALLIVVPLLAIVAFKLIVGIWP
jgi:hypothetical protein